MSFIRRGVNEGVIREWTEFVPTACTITITLSHATQIELVAG
jgi:hypothetical protein